MQTLVNKIGLNFIIVVSNLGKVTIMFVETIFAMRKFPKYIQQIVEQFIFIGRKSLMLVLITSVFVGLAIGVEIGFQMTGFTPHWTAGGLILRTILIDLGPITLGLVLSGRISAGIASELGTMKVTEQIDALISFAIDPTEFLVMPRFIAGIIVVPVLIIFSNFISILFAYYSCNMTINLSWVAFVKGLRYSYNFSDVLMSLIKSFIFGIIIVFSGSYFGLNSRRGARGVGKATTQAVVLSSIFVFVFDYLVSLIMFYI